MKDLFETPGLIPKNVQAVLETFDENSNNTYLELERILNEIEPLGYTFDYYLDAEPYGLRPIGVELVELEGLEHINDWYGMVTPIDNEPYLTLDSSWGSITCNKKGDIVKVVGDEFIYGERNYLYDIESIDVAEYLKFLKDNNIEFYDDADILSVGFTRKNGEYDGADKKWRDKIYLGITEEEVKNEPPTELCKTPQTHQFVKDIIAKLKVIDVDGETMEYILEQVGMSEQMLRQLARKDPK